MPPDASASKASFPGYFVSQKLRVVLSYDAPESRRLRVLFNKSGYPQRSVKNVYYYSISAYFLD